jgi:hypothetical protein
MWGVGTAGAMYRAAQSGNGTYFLGWQRIWYGVGQRLADSDYDMP